MSPLPNTTLIPTTAHRILRTANAEDVVRQLLSFGINASAFLMDPEQIESLETEEFVNDFDCAFEDFFYQIPEELRWEIFPVEEETKKDGETKEPPAGGR